MLLTSVILVLRETLEAALLISILAVVSRHLRQRVTWLPLALVIGTPLALLYAANMRSVSNWFDYVGQEVVNAAMQVSIGVAVVVLTWLMVCVRPLPSAPSSPIDARRLRWLTLCAALTVSLAITREGAEIAVYLGGFLVQPDRLPAVLAGSFVGASIGISVGILVYYGLMALRGRARQPVLLILLAMTCGNMLAQSVLQLTQADLLPAGSSLWDSSAWLAESSIAGQLLYSLVGYESTPSALQAWAYLGGIVVVWLAALAGGTRR